MRLDELTIVIVKNFIGSGSVRICLKLKDLNNPIKKEYYSIPILNDLTIKLSKSKIFSCLNLKMEFCRYRWIRKVQNIVHFLQVMSVII